MKTRITLVLVVLVAALAAITAAYAGSCANLSRPAATEWSPGDPPLVRGHWVWIPSVCPECVGTFEFWGFIAPGDFGTNGNYQNGATVSLLGLSAVCDEFKTVARQETHGIQTGCH